MLNFNYSTGQCYVCQLMSVSISFFYLYLRFEKSSNFRMFWIVPTLGIFEEWPNWVAQFLAQYNKREQLIALIPFRVTGPKERKTNKYLSKQQIPRIFIGKHVRVKHYHYIIICNAKVVFVKFIQFLLKIFSKILSRSKPSLSRSLNRKTSFEFDWHENLEFILDFSNFSSNCNEQWRNRN